MSQFSHAILEQDKRDSRFQFLHLEAQKRGQIQDRRQDWYKKLRLKNKKAVLFEFEMLLLGIDRFFQKAKYSDTSLTHLITKDFSQELAILYESLSKIVHLCDLLLHQSDRAFSFRQFVGKKAPSDELFQEELSKGLEQQNPIDSLYLLSSGMKSHCVIIENLLQNEIVPFHVFEHLGFLINRELNQNIYFNPKQFSQFTPFYDRISSDVIQHFIKSIRNSDLRKVISLILLVFFRILNYLKFIPKSCNEPNLIRKTLVIFSLISTEIKNLTKFIKLEVQNLSHLNLQNNPYEEEILGVIFALEIIQKRWNDDHSRAYDIELNVFHSSREKHLHYAKSIDICHQILFNSTRQSVIDIVQVFNKDLDGNQIFPDYFSTLEQAKKLRNDLCIFDKILNSFDEAVKSEKNQSVAPYFRCILEFTEYFETIELQALRIFEYDNFKQYISKIWDFSAKMVHKTVTRKDVRDFKELIGSFRSLIQKTLQGVESRKDIQRTPPNWENVETVYQNYMKRFQKAKNRLASHRTQVPGP